MKGKHHTTEAREKIRKASEGRQHAPDSREKLSQAHKGKVLSPEHRAKLSAKKKGIPLSLEHKEKIASATTGKKPVICVETGEIHPSITAAARALGVSDASVNQSIRKSCRCKGFHFRFQ